ncbi:hypothetical protein MMC13_002350 [Lambiella insularis]|nr:hypothetical protein [Lambiella insularis]
MKLSTAALVLVTLFSFSSAYTPPQSGLSARHAYASAYADAYAEAEAYYSDELFRRTTPGQAASKAKADRLWALSDSKAVKASGDDRHGIAMLSQKHQAESAAAANSAHKYDQAYRAIGKYHGGEKKDPRG